ncbi:MULTISPECIES: hypothetical protein [Thiorhodovibrio]|uniref:hypothetical protein n=1 Tax=Thiorhodovibrio TaxID=61593 RepID=UPI0019119229|nr:MULTISPECIES: hypothetical protein [Thiorhodovibrio]WPL12637.1 hypothetical protein Thiosp_02411 [Thiorhodovibrio litoralis]
MRTLTPNPLPWAASTGGWRRLAAALSCAAVVTLLGACETLPSVGLGQGGVDAPLAESKGLQSQSQSFGLQPFSLDSTNNAAAESGADQSGGDFLAAFFGGGCQAGGKKDCAEEEAKQADDCLRQAIELPHTTSYRDDEMRRLLGCAERRYRKALTLSASEQGSIRRVAYHGGLLLALSERRNRLDDNTAEPRVGRENRKLLEAADDTRDEAPESALGFLYGASARLFRATLSDDPVSVCSDLREAAAMLNASPPPPDALAAEQQRLSEVAGSELKRCETLAQLAARGDAVSAGLATKASASSTIAD